MAPILFNSPSAYIMFKCKVWRYKEDVPDFIVNEEFDERGSPIVLYLKCY